MTPVVLYLFDHDDGTPNGSQCISLDSIMDEHNLTLESEISSSNLKSFIVDEMDRYECIENWLEKKKNPVEYSLEQSYGYGTLALVIISIIPIFLFFIIPSDKKWYYPYVMNTLM